MNIQAMIGLEKIKEVILAMKRHKLHQQGRFSEEVTVSLRQDDLMAWNKAQAKLWITFVKNDLVDMDNMNAFGQFGRWFYNFVLAHKEFPTMEDITGEEDFFFANPDEEYTI
jgi:hypothetical protein